MKESVPIGAYSEEYGLRLEWSVGFRIEVTANSGEILIRANKAGLTSLAQHLLTLAQDGVPAGTHIHLAASQELEDDSSDLVLERGMLVAQLAPPKVVQMAVQR